VHCKCLLSITSFLSITRGTFFSIAQKIHFLLFSLLFFFFYFCLFLFLAKFSANCCYCCYVDWQTHNEHEGHGGQMLKLVVSFRYRYRYNYCNRYRLRLRCAILMDMSKAIYFKSHIYQFCLRLLCE